MDLVPPSEVGARAEMAVANALVVAGKKVFVPLFSPHSRIDLVVEHEGRLQRVQCKTSRLRGDVILFRTCSNTANVPKSYQGEIDLFGVYSPELDSVFLVPIAEVPSRVCHLRLGPTRNGQVKKLTWAADYVLGPASSEGGAAS